MFQHTAARRRLHVHQSLILRAITVSTHSRPKAAAQPLIGANEQLVVSTHSRPKAAAA